MPSPAAPMGWLDTIVNVNWGGPIAALLFQSTWSDIASSMPPGITVTLPQLSLTFDLLTNSDETYQPNSFVQKHTIMHPLTPYQKATDPAKGPPYITTTTIYNTHTTFDRPPNSGYGQAFVSVVSDNFGFVFWSQGLSSGVGNIAAYGAYILTQGWDAFFIDSVGPPTTDTSHTTMHQVTQNEILLFDMQQIYNALTAAPHFDVKFTTPQGPQPILHGPYAAGYTWEATMQTFGGVTFNSFKPTAQNLPGPTWPKTKTQQIVTPAAGTPVPSKDIDFTVPLVGIH